MNPFSYFDHIACINLFSREDRYQYCQSLFKKLNIDVHFHRVHKHPDGGEAGCFQSHLQIIQEAFNRGAEHCLIFEDDIELGPSYDIQLIQSAIDFMKSNDKWELFYFGCTPEIFQFSMKHLYSNIYQLKAFSTHSYVIHRRLMEKMIGMRYVGVAIDKVYLQNRQAYGSLPSLFYQRPDKSDISDHTLPTSQFRRSWHKIVDYYAMYINYPLHKLLKIISIIFILLLILYIINPSNRMLYLIILLVIAIILMLPK